MSTLERLSRDVFVGTLVSYFDLFSVLSLCQCNRAFRKVLVTENVWRVLHARDHPVLQAGQPMRVFRQQMQLIYNVVAQRDVQKSGVELSDALLRLVALMTIVVEKTDDRPMYENASRRFHAIVAHVVQPWGFQTAFVRPDASQMLSNVPRLATRDAFVDWTKPR
jgi:hypothetical protein